MGSPVSRTRRKLYRWARILGDVEALASGNPKRIAKRAINKGIGRKLIRRLWL